MKRLIPAILAGATITSLIVLVMIQLIALDEPEPTGSAVFLPVETVEPLTVKTVFDEPKARDCDQRESDFSAKLVQSRSCEVDADCALAHFGCPFGCMTSVNKSSLNELNTAERAFQQKCHRCVYSCAAPLFEWRAACVQKRCAVLDRSVKDFERETLDLINDSN